ncbi:hypothetical protein [Actinoplanes sp. NPDC051851]|uniref:hypothetical protein n=1 Tax=Actinoplanes sp. NPDC051851 TaxID=3154753 RepID=UPI003427C357
MTGFVLVVDRVAHAKDIARFWRKVVRGPGPACWIWTGAIGDDGYGSFSIRRSPLDGDGVPLVDGETGRVVVREHVVSAPRFALAAVLGVALTEADVAEHVVCDEPICVRAHDGLHEGALSHLAVSTQAENLATMGRRGRGGGTPRPWQARGPDRQARVARSRALRDAVKGRGWDAGRIAEALAALKHGDQPTLF